MCDCPVVVAVSCVCGECVDLPVESRGEKCLMCDEPILAGDVS